MTEAVEDPIVTPARCFRYLLAIAEEFLPGLNPINARGLRALLDTIEAQSQPHLARKIRLYRLACGLDTAVATR